MEDAEAPAGQQHEVAAQAEVCKHRNRSCPALALHSMGVVVAGAEEDRQEKAGSAQDERQREEERHSLQAALGDLNITVNS